jgi:hypothetical protein
MSSPHPRLTWTARLGLLGTAAVLGLAGCGDSGSDAADPVTPLTTVTSPSTSATTLAAGLVGGTTTTPKPAVSKPKATAPKTAESATPTHRSTTAPAPPAPATPHAAHHPQGALLGASGSGVTAIGDSVMIDAAPSLERALPGIKVDADVSRQVGSGLAEIYHLRKAGNLGSTVVFALGTNGTFSSDSFSGLLRQTKGRTLVVVTGHCPHCSWTPTNNAMIHARCTVESHCVVADWDALADEHPSWFSGDGVHMAIGGTGADAYAQMVASALLS